MEQNYFNRSLIILIPLVGIVTVGVYLISFGITDAGASLKLLVHGITMTAGIWMGCMVIVSYLWRRFPWEETPLLHLSIEVSLILALTLLFGSGLYFIEKKFWDIPKIENFGMEVFTTILITFLITAIYESVFFYRQWKFNFSKSIRLEKAHIEAKYEALRAQINPHFLFNSLNSLTAMVEDNKPVVDYIHNLSGLLRYMMKSNEKELVLLRDEIEITNSYISLQQLRFTGSLEISVTVPESFYNYAVPPLALQMLVENCFKHNIISKDKPLKVEISANGEAITVRNNLQKMHQNDTTGQGLKNIIGRYSFFTAREIEISDDDGHFTVTIPLLNAEL
jgi:hypothetical protein